MSLVLNTVSAIQLCAGCTIEFEPMDTLGAAEDPAGVGIFAEVPARGGSRGISSAPKSSAAWSSSTTRTGATSGN